MILLTTPSARSRECAAAIEADTGHVTRVADSLPEAVSYLRDGEYGAVILDEGMLEADPGQAEVLLEHTGAAAIVSVNCAITGTERIVRELRGALRRREKELQAARGAAEEALRSDLREPLTAMLLECDLALSLPNVSPVLKDKLRSIHEFARSMQDRLHTEEPALTNT